MWTFLKRVDGDKKMDRWYAVGVQKGLFGEIVLARLWGSRANRYQLTMICPFENPKAAQIAAGQLIEQKLRRGYRITSTANR